MRSSQRSLTVVATIGILSALLPTPAARAADIVGTATGDVLFGSAGDDTMDGLGGDDVIFGRVGNDFISGGLDADIIFLGSGRDFGSGSNGDDILVDDDGRAGDQMNGGSGDDRLFSADGKADEVACAGDNDIAVVDDVDIVVGCEVVVTVNTVVGTESFEFGTKKADLIFSGGLKDVLLGKNGKDRLLASGADDWLLGGPKKDSLAGSSGADRLVDDDGKPGDSLKGQTEDDVIFAADGAADLVDCGSGTLDIAFVDPSDDVVNCETVFTA